MALTDLQLERIRATPLFGTDDAKAVVEALGAEFQEEEAASRQGGGGFRRGHRWPGGAAIDLRIIRDIELSLELLASWGCWAQLVLRDRPKGGTVVYHAAVGATGRWIGEGEARTPVAAIWLAAIDAQLRPYGPESNLPSA